MNHKAPFIQDINVNVAPSQAFDTVVAEGDLLSHHLNFSSRTVALVVFFGTYFTGDVFRIFPIIYNDKPQIHGSSPFCQLSSCWKSHRGIV